MNLKLDENLGHSVRRLLEQGGHDVSTVRMQGISGVSDDQLLQICRTSHRCLVTLDLDYSNPLRYHPWEYAGMAVLRLPPKSGYEDLVTLCQTLILGLGKTDITGKLWIVQKRTIREYRPPREEGEEADDA